MVLPMPIKAMNDWGVRDNGGSETFHLAPNQLVDLCQILQHNDNASYRDAYDKESDKEDGTKLEFGPDRKLSTKDDRKWNTH